MIKKEDLMMHASSLKILLGNTHSFATLFGLGVVLGFVTKKFFRITLMAVVVALAIIKGLEYQEVLKIDWNNVTSYIGIDPGMPLEELAIDFYSMAVSNLYLTVTFVVGFIVGHKAGS